MKLLQPAIEYNDYNGSIKLIRDDIWVWGSHENNHIIIPVIPQVPGWAFIEEPTDTPTYETVEYKRSGHYSKGWTNYSRIK